MISGVYEIKNKLNNHRYIGSSVNILSRFSGHKYDLHKNKHHSTYLQRAWNKYGESNFEFNILETCEPVKDTLLFIEQKYLDLKPEYNICKIAGNSMGVKHSKEFCIKQSLLKKGVKNKRRFTEEEFKQFKKRHSEWALSSKWVYDMRKPIIMLDKQTKEPLKEFGSAVEAAIFLGNRNKQVNISYAASGKRKSASGYKWIFKNIDYGV
jgi:group I intron endonuclease